MNIDMLSNGMDSLKRGFSCYHEFSAAIKDKEQPSLEDYFILKLTSNLTYSFGRYHPMPRTKGSKIRVNVEQTVNELAEVGIECEPIRVDSYTGKKMTFFHDPDGLPLELHE